MTLRFRAECKTPIYERAESLLTRRGRSTTGCEQPESVRETFQNLVERKNAHSGDREFDRQRNSLELNAQTRRRSSVVLVEDETGTGGLCAFLEQSDRLELLQGFNADRRRVDGNGERRYRIKEFFCHGQ